MTLTKKYRSNGILFGKYIYKWIKKYRSKGILYGKCIDTNYKVVYIIYIYISLLIS